MEQCQYLRNCAPTPPLTLAVPQILTLIRHGSILKQTLIRHRRSHLILMMTSVLSRRVVRHCQWHQSFSGLLSSRTFDLNINFYHQTMY